MSEANLAAVQAIYAAFGRGDVEALLDAMTDDVEWREVGRPSDFPAFGDRRGKAEVANFLRFVGESADFTAFEVGAMDAAGDKVFVTGFNSRVFKRTGKTAAAEWCQIFTFREGKVARFIEYIDTAPIAEAYRG